MAERLTGRRRVAALIAVVLAAAATGCAVATHEPRSGESRVIRVDGPGRAGERVAPSRCPAALEACRRVEGRIVFVEAHDPDGDGDAHFVVVDSQGITLPGLTAIAVPRRLRPHPLPGLGELVSAAGRVEVGSHGEDEIKALDVHVAHRNG